MSRIDELTQELCPDGVERRPLGEFATLVRGNGMPKTDLVEEGVGAVHYGQIYTRYGVSATETFSFVSPEKAAKLAKVEPGDIIITNTSENIDDVGKALVWVGDAVIVTGGHATVIKHDQDSKFLAYWFASADFYAQKRKLATGTKVIDVSAKQLATVRIPVPPLEVQREIVRVMDKFTQLEAELEAELEARRAQYEHYRAGLLKFDLDQVDSVTVLDGFETRNGYTPAKSDPTNWTNGTVPWFRMEDIRENGRVLDSALQTIPEKAVKGGRYFPANSLIFATSATIGEHALITVPFMSNQRFTAIWPKQDYADRFDMKFLFYYGFVIDEWCRNNTTTSSFASVDMVNFKRLRIPIPPMEEQKCVANQLDHFDALVNDISIGLPAELASRRKQYEYYRDRLLTFKEEAV